MPIDINALLGAAPQLGGMLGSLGSGPGAAGAMAGLGDRHHAENERTYAGVKQTADELEKITSEEWGEDAHMAAMQARLNLLNPKTISKIYGNPAAAEKAVTDAWTSVHAASGRPTDTAAQTHDRNAAAGALPGQKQQMADASANPQGDSGMQSAGGAGMGGLALLGNMGQATMAGAAAQQSQQTMAAPPQGTKYGPLSPGERAQRMQQMMPGDAGGDASGWRMSMGSDGKARWTQVSPSFTIETHHLRDANGREFMGPVKIDHHGGPMLDANTDQPLASSGITSVAKVRSDSAMGIDTVGADGQAVRRVGYASNMVGKDFDKPIQNKILRSTGPNGEQYQFDVRPGINGQPSTVVDKRQLGVMPFADFKAQMYALGVTGKQFTNAINDYRINGFITLPGGEHFTPPGAVLGENGEAISPLAGAGSKPTTRQAFKVGVARDLVGVIDDTLAIADRLESKYGPITGKITDWSAKHGINMQSNPQDAEAVGRLISNTTSIGGLTGSVHSLMSGEFAKSTEEMLGQLGQDFHLARGKFSGLRDFAQKVTTTSAYTALPTQKNPKGGVGFQPTGPRRPSNVSRPNNVTTSPAANSKQEADMAALRAMAAMAAKIMGGTSGPPK